MIFPIVAYGAPILRKVAKKVTPEYPDLDKLIDSLWETMYASNGVGLAAPQVNKDLRLFILDSKQIFENLDKEDIGKYSDDPGTKRTILNAEIIELEGEEWCYNEGCLSIPKIREDIYRPEKVTFTYMDQLFQTHTETFTGITARIFLHEYDHIEGKLFIDYIKPLRKKLIQGKLNDIAKGKIKVDYKMILAK